MYYRYMTGAIQPNIAPAITTAGSGLWSVNQKKLQDERVLREPSSSGAIYPSQVNWTLVHGWLKFLTYFNYKAYIRVSYLPLNAH